MKFITIIKFFIARLIFFILSNYYRGYNLKKEEIKIERHNLKWNLLINDAVGLTLFLFSRSERKNIYCCSKFIKKNTVLVDVGANIGTFCINFYAKYSKLVSKIYAIEPDYVNFNLLKKNIKNNFFQNKILPRNILITNNEKFIPIYSRYPIIKKKPIYSRYPILNISFTLFNLINFKKKESINIYNFFAVKGNVKKARRISIDKIKFKKSKNYILKIDVDGNEFQVMKSAKFFIETKKPMILLEISRLLINKKQFNYIINFLDKNNYNLILFNKFKISPKIIKFDFRNFGIDYFFVHKDHF